MSTSLRILFLSISISFSLVGYCQDTTIVRLIWIGEVDKPFYTLTFSARSSLQCTDTSSFFNLQYRVSLAQMGHIRRVLFSYPKELTYQPHNLDWWASNYLIEIGTDCSDKDFSHMESRRIQNFADLEAVRNQIMGVFKGTNEAASVNEGWQVLFSRLPVAKPFEN